MHGIVLAAGAATRMPNKGLLSLPDGTLVVESAIWLLHNWGCEAITVVVSRDSLVEDLLKAKGYNNLRFERQDTPRGVPNAIGLGAHNVHDKDDLHVVTFCDCVYRGISLTPVGPHASVRRVDDDECQLDAWDPFKRRWVRRDEAQPDMPRFLGWLALSNEQAHAALAFTGSCVDFFNVLAIPGAQTSDGFVMDVGTPQAYKRFITSSY